MRSERVVHARDESGERVGCRVSAEHAVMLPIAGEVVVVKHIDEDRRVVAVAFAKPGLAPRDDGVGICVGVDAMMLTDRFEHRGRRGVHRFLTALATHEVGQHTPDLGGGGVGGQKEVGEEVHGSLRLCVRRRTS